MTLPEAIRLTQHIQDITSDEAHDTAVLLEDILHQVTDADLTTPSDDARLIYMKEMILVYGMGAEGVLLIAEDLGLSAATLKDISNSDVERIYKEATALHNEHHLDSFLYHLKVKTEYHEHDTYH